MGTGAEFGREAERAGEVGGVELLALLNIAEERGRDMDGAL